MQEFWANLRAAPRRFMTTAFRSGAPKTDRTRSTFIFGNVFLHLHAVRTHRWSLRWGTTAGLGIATTAAFLITLITGVLLMFYYKPYPDVAYDSIKDLHFVVPTGRFIRNIHRWAANLMVVAVILHMARAFFTAAYRKPREFNWLIGMGLFVITLGLSFTGYLLPWDWEKEGTGDWFGGPGGWPLVWRSIIVGLVSSLAIEAFVIRFGWLREWFPTIHQLVITFVNPGTVLTMFYALYSVWARTHTYFQWAARNSSAKCQH